MLVFVIFTPLKIPILQLSDTSQCPAIQFNSDEWVEWVQMPHVKGSGPFQMPTAKGRGLQAPVFFSAWLTTNLGVPMTPLSFDSLLGQLTEVRKAW